jgi:hypothetical protein
MIEPTMPANPYDNNPYEKTVYGGIPDIPPPPPGMGKRKHKGVIITLVLLAILLLGGVGAYSIYASGKQQVSHIHAATKRATPTVTQPGTKRVTSTATQSATPTPTPTKQTATPTPMATPAPYNGPTAYGLYTVFTQDPSVTMLPASQGGGPFTVPTRDWIACCGFYPGHGGYSLEDEYSPGYTTTFCIAVFNTANDASLIANQISNGGKYPVYCNYGYSPSLFAIQVNQCILIYIPSLQYSNIRGYISDMNNYCG